MRMLTCAWIRWPLLAAFVSGLIISCSGGSTSNTPAPPAPAVASPQPADVLTWHNDAARTGQNLSETTLTPANVAVATFGQIGNWSVDGEVMAQPLVVNALTMQDGKKHNVVFVVTEHDSVYAFDVGGTALWQRSMLASGETTSDSVNCYQIEPELGITATPAIDRGIGPNGTIFVVAMSKNGSGQYFQRLHALDLASGAEQSGSPVTIQANFPGSGANSSNGQVIFDPMAYNERAALLISGGAVVTTWGSHCDVQPYTGWVMSFDEHTLAMRSLLNITPNGSGGAFWASGAGPAADAAGAVYMIAGNGTFDTSLDSSGFPQGRDFGNAFLKFNGATQLSVADYFAVSDTVAESAVDGDLGSGGAMVLPDQVDSSGVTRHLAVGAGKDMNIYVVDRDSMGKFDPADNDAYQTISGSLGGGIYGAPAYFNGSVYYGANGQPLRAFPLSAATLMSNASSQTGTSFRYPGTTPSISANGSSNAIVWAVENGSGSQSSVLHAYDATNLGNELYNSNQNPGRDNLGAPNKFITPTVTGGKVYVGTTNSVAVFGLL